jgi:hypothetical protein
MPQGNPMTSRNNSAAGNLLYKPSDWLQLKGYSFCNDKTSGVRHNNNGCKSTLVQQGTDNTKYFNMTDYWDLINNETISAASTGVNQIPLITNTSAQFDLALDFNTARHKDVHPSGFSTGSVLPIDSCAQFYASGKNYDGGSTFLDLVHLRFHVGQTESNTNMDEALNLTGYNAQTVLPQKQMYAVQTAFTDVAIYVEPEIDDFDTTRSLLTQDDKRH